jgi:hypothetical protein
MGVSCGFDPNSSSSFGLKNKAKSTPSVGFRNNCVATANDKQGGEGYGVSNTSDQPVLLVGKCSWGATPKDMDTVSIYRVSDGPDGQPILIPGPLSQVSELVDQEKLDTLYFSYGGPCLFDEMRVGPTYNSVLMGTVAGTANLVSPKPNPKNPAVVLQKRQ